MVGRKPGGLQEATLRKHGTDSAFTPLLTCTDTPKARLEDSDSSWKMWLSFGPALIPHQIFPLD